MQKKEKREEYKMLWAKRLPFKINFFLWRAWKRRIATDDNLKRMKINNLSICWCYEVKEEETMNHLYLTTPITAKLWREFAKLQVLT